MIHSKQKAKTVQPQEQNTGEILCDLKLRQDFLHETQKGQIIK